MTRISVADRDLFEMTKEDPSHPAGTPSRPRTEGGQMSGELLTLTVERLAAHGLTLVERDDREFTWMIRTNDAEWELVIYDPGRVELMYWPEDRARNSREHRADLAALLLTGKPRANRQPPKDFPPTGTDLSWIGLSLRHNDFDAAINVNVDEVGLCCYPDIAVTLNTNDHTETVYVEGDGSVLWCRDYAPEHATYDPGRRRVHVPDPPTVADAITAAIVPAITHTHLATA
jgi:hypothetical protein